MKTETEHDKFIFALIKAEEGDTREGVKCPLCGAFAVYQKRRKKHFWICEECPFVGTEKY